MANHDVRIILRGMNVKRQRERYRYPEDPHAVVLGHLIERVDEHAKDQGEWALLIADEVQGQHTYRQDLWAFQRYATPGYRSRKIVRVVDTMHFVPSHASRLVQAADLIAFLHRRRRTHVEKDERVSNANEALWAYPAQGDPRRLLVSVDSRRPRRLRQAEGGAGAEAPG